MNNVTWLLITILAVLLSFGSLPLFGVLSILAYIMVYSSAILYGVSLAHLPNSKRR